MKNKLIVMLMSLMLLIPSVIAFSGNGEGTINEPYEVTSWAELDEMRNNLTAHYVLMNDLDSTTPGYADYAGPLAHGGEGWNRTGHTSHGFVGSFDGQGNTISDLYINRPGEQYASLFGRAREASIKNLNVLNANVTGNEAASILVGYIHSTTIDNVVVSGTVEGHHFSTGGLISIITEMSVVNNSAAYVDVTGHNWGTGGLLAEKWSDSLVENSYATGNVQGHGGATGGLVGSSDSMILNSYATGNVTDETNFAVGGLVGEYYSDSSLLGIFNSYATGKVIGDDNVGGLVGYAEAIPIEHSYATGDVEGRESAGGLVGYGEGTQILFSHATGNVLNEQWQGGGLVGWADSETFIKNSYATGDVTQVEDWGVGGLVGYLDHSTIENSFSTGDVIQQGAGAWSSGGLVGEIYRSHILNSYATGNVQGDEGVGGITGYACTQSTIIDSYAISNIIGTDFVGGLVGDNVGSQVTNSYWDINTSGLTTSDGGEPKTTEELQNIATFSAWDISLGEEFVDETWFITENNYPKLFYELVHGCTDEEATNYDSEANVDDGSCEYPSPATGGGTRYTSDGQVVGAVPTTTAPTTTPSRPPLFAIGGGEGEIDSTWVIVGLAAVVLIAGYFVMQKPKKVRRRRK